MSKKLPKTKFFFKKIAIGNFFEKKKKIFGNFFEKMSSFWQFFDIQMAIFWRVSLLVLIASHYHMYLPDQFEF